ncbi:hypothetical protein KAU88_04260 [Candidatus Bathyarchaeota archaeon]|nr:hypothetical protein [Candidatus Bathyarchaeota archaeon]
MEREHLVGFLVRFVVLQIIAGFFLYNRESFLAVAIFGWIIMIVGFVIGLMGVSTLRE